MWRNEMPYATKRVSFNSMPGCAHFRGSTRAPASQHPWIRWVSPWGARRKRHSCDGCWIRSACSSGRCQKPPAIGNACEELNMTITYHNMTQRPAELIVRHDFTLISPKKSAVEPWHPMKDRQRIDGTTAPKAWPRLCAVFRKVALTWVWKLRAALMTQLPISCTGTLNCNVSKCPFLSRVGREWRTLELGYISRLVQTKCTRFHGQFLAVKICQDVRRRY